MLLGIAGLEDYVLDVAELAERYGVVVAEPAGAIAIDIEPDGSRRFNIGGALPNDRQPGRSRLEMAERWRPVDDVHFERREYRYELLDLERGFRRAWHRHDEDEFEHAYGVVVHEHCEAPIGHIPCAHLFGPPVRDGYQGLMLLVAAWVSDPPDCAALPCLEAL